MGICLDTDKKNESEELKTVNNQGSIWHTEGDKQSDFVKFATPKVPIIFVLGGPGSGKVTHCDSLAEEKRGIIHINMTDLLQQYILSDDRIKDFNQLPSKTVAEVLMLEMKMSPAAKTILVSGYPRNMRDVVEYTDKMKIVSGVILLAWNQSSLEKQIEYGVKLGHVVHSFARMELNNFYRNVLPIADFYDHRKMLVTINGERNPQEVYSDFRVAVLRIIGSHEEIKGEDHNSTSVVASSTRQQMNDFKTSEAVINIQPASVVIPTTTAAVSVHEPPLSGYPAVICVIGGPGSNKAQLIRKILRRIKQWSHISMGEVLRGSVDSRQFAIEEAEKLRDTIAAGKMVDDKLVMQLLDQALLTNINFSGIILDGFPRSLSQLEWFENKYDQHPRVILLDCSKLQLSRGRWDDSVVAFRERLEVFREKTLPMVKVLDTEHRLTMVDGDTNTPEVQEQFNISLLETIEHAQDDFIAEHGESLRQTNTNFEAVILQDLEDELLDTITVPIAANKPAVQMNGYGPPRDQASTKADINLTSANQNPNIIQTHAQIESYPDKR